MFYILIEINKLNYTHTHEYIVAYIICYYVFYTNSNKLVLSHTDTHTHTKQ